MGKNQYISGILNTALAKDELGFPQFSGHIQ